MTSSQNELFAIDRKYIKSDLAFVESSMLNEDGKLSDETFQALFYEIGENLAWFLDDRYEAVLKRLEVESRNTEAEKANPQYKVYWKNDKKFITEFNEFDVCKTLSDAVLITQSKCLHDGSDQFKITKIEDGKECDENYAL